MQAVKGGAIYLEETEENKLKTDRLGKYHISGSTFKNCSANAGGAVYLKSPQFLTIDSGTSFTQN